MLVLSKVYCFNALMSFWTIKFTLGCKISFHHHLRVSISQAVAVLTVTVNEKKNLSQLDGKSNVFLQRFTVKFY